MPAAATPLSGLLLIVCLGIVPWAAAAPLQPGQAAPIITLPRLDAAGTLSLSSLRGKVVYLDFWASWCGPCRVSFPLLDQLRQEHALAGFEVVAINLDEFEQDATRFLLDHPVSYPVVRDSSAETARQYGILGMPTAFLIDRQGLVRHRHQGFRRTDMDALRTRVIELLAESQ